MSQDPIAARYARAVFESAKAAGKADEMLEQLSAIASLCRQHPELAKLINNPDVDPPDKVRILQHLLQGSAKAETPQPDLLSAFLLMVVERGRAEFLPEIADSFQAEIDADCGRLRVMVRSARPLPQEMLAKLKALLEKREKKQLLVETQEAPELIAGVQIILGHRVIDGSILRQLVDLRQRLETVRVY